MPSASFRRINNPVAIDALLAEPQNVIANDTSGLDYVQDLRCHHGRANTTVADARAQMFCYDRPLLMIITDRPQSKGL